MAGVSPTEIDAQVLERARHGDREAHAALYEAFAPMVFTLARRMLGSTAQAEDVLQDSFVEVIRNAAQYRGKASVGGWIRRIAINKCLSHLRSPWVTRCAGTASEERDEGTTAGLPDPVGGPRAGSDPATQIELLRALDRLADTARVVVWLHDIEGYTHAEIATLMGRSPSFSKSQLMRAYQQLRDALAVESGAGPAKAQSAAPVAQSAEVTNGESKPCIALKTV